jgi:Flp pilus assembly pilin Flp
VGRKDQRNGYYSFEEGAIISRPYHDCLVGAGRMDVLQEVGHQADQAWRRIEPSYGGANMSHLLRRLWRHDEGQDIAEYAVMLAVILVLVAGTVRLIGSNANNVFSSAASSIQ